MSVPSVSSSLVASVSVKTAKDCADQIQAFQDTLQKMSSASAKVSSELGSVARTLPSTLSVLSTSQKLALFGVTAGSLALYFVSRWAKRRRKSMAPGRSIRAVRRARQISLSSRQGGSAESTLRRGGQSAGGTSGGAFAYNWSELQRHSMAPPSDKDSVASGATLVDGTPLTPQQLGLMGMEALETAVSYWEDALAAYNPKAGSLGGSAGALTTAEETKFIRALESILEGAFQLQEESESLFIHQNSILNRTLKDLQKKQEEEGRHSRSGFDSGSMASFEAGSAGLGSKCNLLSVSTVDQDSFVSAQDTIADLRDFDELIDIIGETDPEQELYLQALAHLEETGIPYRALRTEFTGCSSDADYLAKLHCLRLAFKHIMGQEEIRIWWVDSGRTILSALIVRADKDPKDFIQAYNDLIEYLSDQEHIDQMAQELESRNVKCTNFYDVVLDYILIDSFEDLDAPPSSVLAVMKNRWLSDGFKESALQTAVWSVLKAKRRLLHHPNGFKAQFYNLSEILTPTLAWGFFGPDEKLNSLMVYFKDQVMAFIQDLFSFQHIRLTNLEEMTFDVMKLARTRLEGAIQHLQNAQS